MDVCQKPFDETFCKAMEMTARDLMLEFQACTAYTFSDEISLIFVPIQDEITKKYRELKFNGKIQKLVSLMASYAATRFTYHFFTILEKSEIRLKSELKEGMTELELLEEDYRTTETAIFNLHTRIKLLDQIRAKQGHLIELKDKLSKTKAPMTTTLERFKKGQLAPYFDCRIFNLPNKTEVYNYIFWRSNHDAYRNSVHAVAMCHFSTRQLHKKNVIEMKAMLLAEKKIDYEQVISDRNKYGIFFKKEVYAHESKYKGSVIVTNRTRPVSFTQRLSGYDESFADLLLAKLKA